MSDVNIRLLILGSLPGDESLRMGRYYAHPRNRFWRVMAAATDRPLPADYEGCKAILSGAGLGLWDVAHTASRRGSLDSAIGNVTPNDIEGFISSNPELRVICFNGRKAEALYDRFFTRREGITYISLPSTSPANAGISFEVLCDRWKQALRADSR